MDHESIFEELKDIITLYDDPNWESYSPLRQGLLIAQEVSEAACVILNSIPSDGDLEKAVDQIVAVAEEIFDLYIVPIDLPVNNLIEKMGENYIRNMIRPIVESAAEALEEKLK